MSTRYVALLRGINVGGRNNVRMADMRDAFDRAGYSDVGTYIQSGNVMFVADETDREELARSIESMLSEAFDYRAIVTLRSRDQLRATVADAPDGFGDEPDEFHYDVMFLIPPLRPEETLALLTLKDGVDAAWTGPEAVYFSRLTARLTASALSRIVSTPSYQSMTIRAWSTTTKLLRLMDEYQA